MSISETRKLPVGWRWAKLGECVELINGRAYSQHELLDSGTPVIRIQNLNGGDNWYYSDLNLPDEKYCHDGDLLFAWSATFGPYIWRGSKAIFHYHIWKVITLDCLDQTFAHFLLHEITQEIREASHGMAMLHMTKSGMENWMVPLPPLPEQRRIAAILTEKMAAVEKARTAAEARLQAAKELPATYLREVFESEEAQGWPKRVIGDVAETSSGSTPSRARDDYYGGDIPWVKTGELCDEIIDATEEHITALALKENSLRILPAGTLLIAMYGQGQTRGRTALLRIPAATNQACFAILPNNERFVPEYIQYWFRHIYRQLRDETEGRGGNQSNLNGMLLRNQVILLPTLPEQQRIVALLFEKIASSNSICNVIEKEAEAIKSLPSALLRQAFAGEI